MVRPSDRVIAQAEPVQAFQCAQTDADYTFVATFESDTDVPSVAGLQTPIRLGTFTPPNTPPQPLPPFWHFEFGGCNDIGMSVSVVKPAGLPATNLWAPVSTSVHVSYAPDSPTGQGVLSFDLEPGSPRSIQAGVTYFAFAVTLHTCTAHVCAGCDEALGLLLGDLNLGLAQVPGPSELICVNQCVTFGPSVASPAASVSSAPVENLVGGCDTTPAVKQTWGQLKVVYR